MTWAIRNMGRNIRTGRPWLLLLLLAAALLLAACDDNDDDGATTPTGEPGSPTPTATSEGGTSEDGDGTPSTGTAGGDGDEAYASALQLALEEEIGSDAGDLVAEWNIGVTPDGQGLPEGSGTVEEGATLYATQCAACHGQEGQGGIGPAVWSDHQGAWEPGAPVVIGTWWPYATTVYDYIQRAMPFFEPGTLSPDEVYAVTAFLLERNGIIEAGDQMDQDTLPDVEMPARDRFQSCWPDLCYDDIGR